MASAALTTAVATELAMASALPPLLAQAWALAAHQGRVGERVTRCAGESEQGDNASGPVASCIASTACHAWLLASCAHATCAVQPVGHTPPAGLSADTAHRQAGSQAVHPPLAKAFWTS